MGAEKICPGAYRVHGGGIDISVIAKNPVDALVIGIMVLEAMQDAGS